MKASILFPLVGFAPAVLSFAYPPADAYSAFELSESTTTVINRDGNIETETTGYRKFYDNLDEDHPDFIDQIFDAIGASMRQQVRNVESHLAEVRNLQEDLYNRMSEFLAVGDMGAMWGGEEGGDVTFWLGGDDGLRDNESGFGEMKKAPKEALNPLDRIGGDLGSDDDLSFERAGIFGEEGFDVDRWFETEEPQLPVSTEYIATLNEQAAEDALESTFTRSSSDTLLDLIKNSKHSSMFYDFIKDYPDIVNRLESTSSNTTVFVPNNHAFKRMLHGKKKENLEIPKEIIEKILTYHLAPGCFDSSALRWRNTIDSALPDDLLGENEHQRLRLGLCPSMDQP